MKLSFCPFCKTITYYPKEDVERAERDGLHRVHCQFCKLFFWPGPVPTHAGVAQR